MFWQLPPGENGGTQNQVLHGGNAAVSTFFLKTNTYKNGRHSLWRTAACRTAPGMESDMSDAILELRGIEKAFDGTPVLRGIDLSAAAGEFITLLGSSGCGKTTTLRIIAGLEAPDEGSVLLEGKDVTQTPPNQRNVNTVFQNYALFPHMTVAENVAYGLKLRRVPREERKQRTREALELVQLAGYEKRKPSQLSGGQKQRVAIARAIVNHPKVLLLDEPLGALDLQLRRQMQIELKRLQKRLGITFIYITHDQEEALNMSDRIVVMHQGRFEQIGTPDEIYDYPETDFVARFVGNANIVEAVVTGCRDGIVTATAEGRPVAAAFVRKEEIPGPQEKILIAVRSERLQVRDSGYPEGIACTVEEISFAGGQLRMSLRTAAGQELVASRHGIRPDRKAGDPVTVTWEPGEAVVVKPGIGNAEVMDRKGPAYE